jgi:hypothetical protein
MNNLDVFVDTAQTRIKRDRITTLIATDDWSDRFRNNVWLDPVNSAAMLMPAPRSEAWATTYTGDYARLKATDYAGLSTDWIQTDIAAEGDHWIKYIGETVAPLVKTTVNQPRNGSMYLAWFASNAASQDWIQIECGFGAGDGTDALSLRVWSGGTVEVWRGGVLDGVYQISGSNTSASTQNQFVDLLIMPYRRRELLVSSNQGAGFTHVFDDIPTNQNDPELWPSAPFWFKVPSGLAQVQCAPIRYATSGYIAGIKSFLSIAPEAGATYTPRVFADANGGGVISSLISVNDPAIPFVPDGLATECRIKIDLTGNGITTPMAYGAQNTYETITTSTPDAATRIDDYLTEARLSVGDSPSGQQFSITVREPAALSELVPNFTNIVSRPVQFVNGSSSFFTGLLTNVNYHEGYDDVISKLEIEIHDKWQLFEDYIFSDQVVLDDLNLSEAVAQICVASGIPRSFLVIEPTPFKLPQSDAPSKTNFACAISAGDRASEWLERLHSNYAGNWYMGWRPTPAGMRFYFCSVEYLGSESCYRLYPNSEAAIDNGADRAKLINYTYRSYKDELLPAESNDIWVTGWDTRSGRPIIGHRADKDAQNPELAPIDRGENWRGSPIKYGLYDHTIATQEALQKALDTMYDRLTVNRLVAEFETDFLIKSDGTPVWRGDVITLEGKGNYRVRSLETQFKKTVDTSTSNKWYWQPTRYTAELITENNAGLSSLMGTSLSSMKALHKLRCVNRKVIRKGSEHLNDRTAAAAIVV